MTQYETIELRFSKAGIHAVCDDIERDVFCVGGDLQPLVELINDVEVFCNPDTAFRITDKGREWLKNHPDILDDALMDNQKSLP